MPYDPAKPASGSPLSSEEMRSQLTSLHSLIPAGAQTMNTTTLPAGSAATADVALTGGVLTFTFGLPAGANGEVTQAQLSNDLANTQNATMLTVLPQTSNNSNAVALLSQLANASYDPLQFQAMLDKADELINALRR